MKRQKSKLAIFMLMGLWLTVGVKAKGKEEAMAVFSMSEKNETCISVKAGHFFSLKFVTSPGTGYSWMLAAALDEKMLDLVEMKNEPPQTNLLGASEYETWLCRALSAGRAEIVLKYVRPWEKDVDPLKRHVFKVKIK